jgi:DNA polymerase-3 subunit beta
MKVNFETKIPINVLEPGSTTVFGDKFMGILNSIPDGEMEFDQNDAKVTIKPVGKKIKFQLKSMASEKFPELPKIPDDKYFELPVKDLKDMVTQTVFAVSDDETRYFMNGIFCEKQGDKLIMVGTDGRRLAYISKDVPGITQEFEGVISPPKILNVILKRTGDEGPIAIAINDKTIFVKFGAYNMSSVLIDGQFPNYKRVIPETQSSIFTFNRLEMLEALKRVSLMVEQKSRRIYLGLSQSGISVTSEESDLGTGEEEIPVKYEGDPVSIALNYRYIEEPLKAMETEEVSVKFTDPGRAITLTPEPEAEYFDIIMPMQVD